MCPNPHDERTIYLPRESSAVDRDGILQKEDMEKGRKGSVAVEVMSSKRACSHTASVHMRFPGGNAIWRWRADEAAV